MCLEIIVKEVWASCDEYHLYSPVGMINLSLPTLEAQKKVKNAACPMGTEGMPWIKARRMVQSAVCRGCNSVNDRVSL
jgi:hypothetical protein